MQAGEDKIKDKQRKKDSREAKRRAQEVAKLRGDIEATFVSRVAPIDAILT